MRRLFLRVFTVALGVIFISIDAPLTSAQESNNYEFTLEEITVTAQKREENLQDVALAMEAISGDEMLELGQNSINEVLSSLSNALVSVGTSGWRVSLRGVSQDDGLPTVAVNTDGVSTYNNDAGKYMFDVERVEVLYGPQSTLYASATPGGVINIITNDPKTDKYEAGGTLEYGTYNLLRSEGILNVPMGDVWAIRAGFSSSTRKGYLSNGGDDEDTKDGRLKLLYKPTDKFSTVITGEFEKTGGGGMSSAIAFINQDDVDDPWTGEDATITPSTSKREKIYGTIKWDLGFGQLTMIPSLIRRPGKTNTASTSTESDGTTVVTSTKGTSTNNEKSFEGRIASSEGSAVTWIGGIVLSKQDTSSITNNYVDDVYDSSMAESCMRKANAIFGNITYPVTDKFSIGGGIRYSKYVQDSLEDEDPAPPGKDMPVLSYVEYTEPDYKVSVEYDIAEESMIYADWSSGFRMQGGGTYGVDSTPVPLEHLTAYTIGSKNRFLGNKIQANFSAFYYDYKDQLASCGVTTIYDENNNGIRDWDDADNDGIKDADEDYTENDSMQDENAKTIGDLEVYGFDLQTSTIISEKDKLNISVSYLIKKWKKLFFDWQDITNELGVADLDYSGKISTFAPKWNVSLTYSHNFNLWNGGTLTSRLEANYKSSYKMYFLDDTISVDTDGGTVTYVTVGPYAEQEGYVIGNLSLIYAHPDGKYTITGYMKNITNYAAKLNINVHGTDVGDMMLCNPRTYGAVLTVKY